MLAYDLSGFGRTSNATGVKVSERTDVCKQWYSAFDERNLDALMALFNSDPVVVVGAGGSERAVPYGGVFKGEREVRRYYARRFAYESEAANDPAAPIDPKRRIRPFCGMAPGPLELGPWVIFSGDIRDHADVSKYDGPFLHVFRFDPSYLKIASLDMFLTP